MSEKKTEPLPQRAAAARALASQGIPSAIVDSLDAEAVVQLAACVDGKGAVKPCAVETAPRIVAAYHEANKATSEQTDVIDAAGDDEPTPEPEDSK